MVGCQGVHGGVKESSVIQVGPNPVLMGRHYPLDVAVQCDVRETLAMLTEALTREPGAEAFTRRRARVRAYAQTLIAREETLVRDHADDAIVHPAVLEAQLATMLPRDTVMVQESSTARTALIPFGHEAMTWTRSGGGSLGWGVGAAVGAKLAVGHARPVVLHLGDGALTYSASGFWTMARYKTPILTIVSNNETYQIVRHNWANQMPDSKMVRDGKYPGLFLGDPPTDYVALAKSQGVDGEAVTTVKDLEPALRRALDVVITRRRPYLLDVTVAREGIGADATWYDDWEM
jgi:benzoylformate decarboxylase